MTRSFLSVTLMLLALPFNAFAAGIDRFPVTTVCENRLARLSVHLGEAPPNTNIFQAQGYEPPATGPKNLVCKILKAFPSGELVYRCNDLMGKVFADLYATNLPKETKFRRAAFYPTTKVTNAACAHVSAQ